jgi:hypothetical protein
MLEPWPIEGDMMTLAGFPDALLTLGAAPIGFRLRVDQRDSPVERFGFWTSLRDGKQSVDALNIRRARKQGTRGAFLPAMATAGDNL